MFDLFALRGQFVRFIVFSLMLTTIISGISTSLIACQSTKLQPKLISNAENKKNLIAINSLLVAPVEFDTAVATNLPSTLDVNAMLSQAISEELQIKIVHSVSSLEKNDGKNKPHPQYANDAKKMKLDGVLMTRLTSFHMREGSELGSQSPARVDLSMQIVNSDNKEVVWQSAYHFKDQALSDNLFKIKDRLGKDKSRFRSAEDLLIEGYRSALKDFSQKRLAGFIN